MTSESRAATDLPPPRVARKVAEKLWADHASGVRCYLRVLGAATQDLDDLLQETFMVLLQRPFEDRGGARMATFLRTTARFQFLRRDRRRLQQIEAADAVWERRCGGDDGAGYLAALRDCVEALPERSRRLVQLGYDEDLGRAAIARELGLKADGVKTALRRLRDGLRQCVHRRLGR